MLEKPAIPNETIIRCLQDGYVLEVAHVEFLPLGADRNTAVYRAVMDDENAYFVKLRRGAFDDVTVIVPRLLHEQGIRQVIAPLRTPTGALWVDLDDYRLTVSPYVAGRNGYDMRLSDAHWVELGRALKAIHTAVIPPAIMDRIPRETYSAHWREAVKRFQTVVAQTTFDDPVSAELAALLNREARTVGELIRRAEYGAAILQAQSPPFILCHADIHAGNVLIDARDHLHVVDWDTLILAPKERDLMFAGGGLFGGARSPHFIRVTVRHRLIPSGWPIIVMSGLCRTSRLTVNKFC